MILGLIGLCVASSAIDKMNETKVRTAEIEAERDKYVAREKTHRNVASTQIEWDAKMDIQRISAQRDVATTQIQWNAMRDIEQMRAQAQAITAGAKSGFYESLFSRQSNAQEQIVDSSQNEQEDSAAKRFCSYCGERINVDSKFCSHCGKRVI